MNFSEERQNAVNQIQLESRELLGQDFRRMTMKGERFSQSLWSEGREIL